ncbi:MAG TPA: cytochrome c3 family protein [Anaeromyxobacteraceae bacterium]|nr:cytochrome c3 family protein [Anaeromyxobacteraceae bacterium]
MKRYLLAFLFAMGAMPAQAGIPAEQDSCLDCHTDESMSFDLPGGEKLSLAVNKDNFAKSVHGEMLRCTDCHSDKKDDHADGEITIGGAPAKTKRELTIAYYEQCKGCHFANYTKTLDGVHFALMSKGNKQAAVCVDCHGAHDITRPGQPRNRISQMCSRCHAEEAKVYAASVHGMAVESSSDVPVCTDCHRAHDTADPREGALAMRTPEICGRCHGNEKLMTKYGLSTHVVDTYLSDFHGMSATLQHKSTKDSGERLAAVCTDCHGVHDIRKGSDPSSQVMAANLQKTCQKCHPGASANFPKAWMSHYQPTLDKAPAVWAAQMFYRILIPFMVGGLVLQIALHLWRVVVNR